MLIRARAAAALVVAVVVSPAIVAAQEPSSGPLAAVAARGSNPSGPFSAATRTRRDSVVARARETLGTRYRWAGTSEKSGFDCSGLVRYVLAAVGVELPHNAARIAASGESVPTDTGKLVPGDLLLFGRGRSARLSHVGIYVGDGKMIHASTGQRRVIEVPVPTTRSSLKLRAVRRVLRPDSTADSTRAPTATTSLRDS
ncbi:MAG: C40 family peptidase [Gemmatimonadaceae bacterium]|nr:C40 family peptidase [Gemmatimonadaceae bacterium]